MTDEEEPRREQEEAGREAEGKREPAEGPEGEPEGAGGAGATGAGDDAQGERASLPVGAPKKEGLFGWSGGLKLGTLKKARY